MSVEFCLRTFEFPPWLGGSTSVWSYWEADSQSSRPVCDVGSAQGILMLRALCLSREKQAVRDDTERGRGVDSAAAPPPAS